MTDISTQPSTVSLGRYRRTLARRWWLVVVCMCLGAAASVGYLAVRPTHATAAALVRLSVISDDPFNVTREPSGLIDGETEVQTARSSAVTSAAAGELGGGFTGPDVRDAVTATMLPNATVLRIEFTADDPMTAIRGADVVAEQYLQYRGQLASDAVDRITKEQTERRDLLQEQLTSLAKQLATLPPTSGAAARAQADRELVRLELNGLMSQMGADATIDVSGGSVLTSAADVGAYVSPRRGLVIGGGVLLGLLVGLVAAVLRDAGDRRVRDTADVVEVGAGPVLATLPESELVRLRPGRQADAVESVREQLVATAPEGRPTVAVLDLGPDRHPAAFAAELALSLSHEGLPVRLVVATPEGADIASVAELLGPAALSVTDDTNVELVLPEQNVAAVVARTGERPGSAVVLAVPWAAGRAARLAAARVSDAVVTVVAERGSRRAELATVVSDVAGLETRVLGSVVVRQSRHPRPAQDPVPRPAEDAVEETVLLAEGQR